MKKINLMILVTSLSLFIGTFAAASGNPDQPPSEAAKGMPGALGTIEFTPDPHREGSTTLWYDTDGVQPGIAGCHYEVDLQGEPTGRSFCESCTPDLLLVESNPGKEELHLHKNDIGHPDTFNCQTWCVGNGHKGGSCKSEDISIPKIENGDKQTSAACSCE